MADAVDARDDRCVMGWIQDPGSSTHYAVVLQVTVAASVGVAIEVASVWGGGWLGRGLRACHSAPSSAGDVSVESLSRNWEDEQLQNECRCSVLGVCGCEGLSLCHQGGLDSISHI